MKPRLIVIFLLIVFLPVAILGWLGVRVARSEQEAVRHRVRELLVSKLSDIDTDIAGLLAERERELLSLPQLSVEDADRLRARARESGVVRQYFVLDRDDNLVYPAETEPRTAGETAFLERTLAIWTNKEIPSSSEEGPAPAPVSPQGGINTAQQPVKGPSRVMQQQAVPMQTKGLGKGALPPATPQKGWYVWYWGGGIGVIFWWRDVSGAIVGAELNPARLMADIVGLLPDTDPEDTAMRNARITLLDSMGNPIYQWGVYEAADGETPRATLALSPPLGSWRLAYYASDDIAGSGYGRGALMNLLSGLAALGVAILGLAVYYYRENARAFREAAQRITFVNQVSHELKTPLTSIRMYAEMLEDELDEADETPRRHLGVIVSESQRLSRLIANVLTFGRTQRRALKLNAMPGAIDESLGEIIEHFREPLAAKGIAIVFHGAAAMDASFDRDALEQIIGNLLNNVEKYAVTGDRVEIVSQQCEDTVTITVADNGPGIPARERDRIFRPFYRVSDKLTDGVAGTGIGLAIARDLARLHGGDLTLERSEEGARFKLTLDAPRAAEEKP